MDCYLMNGMKMFDALLAVFVVVSTVVLLALCLFGV